MGQLKYDYPPMLSPGRHFMSLTEVERLTAIAYTDAGLAQRTELFLSLEALVQALLVAEIRCDVFVDGSFLTKKPRPDDVDVIVTVEHSIYEALSDEQMALLDSINANQFGPNVDATAWVSYPREHPHHGTALDGSNVFQGYGVEHSGQWLKGFAVLRLWNNVGNLIGR
jgi:hypothetical protein